MHRTLRYDYSLCCFVGQNGTAVGKGAIDKTAQARCQVLPKTLRQLKVGRERESEKESESVSE